MEQKIQEGQKAPEFRLPGSDGREHSLSDYQGKMVILYFYPKDNTPGCTVEAQGFTETHTEYTERNAVILGVSKDSLKSHDNFIAKIGIPFVLLSDAEGKTMDDYDVIQEKTVFGKTGPGVVRSTFIIDGEGIVRKIYRKPKTDDHAAQVLLDLNALLG